MRDLSQPARHHQQPIPAGGQLGQRPMLDVPSQVISTRREKVWQGLKFLLALLPWGANAGSPPAKAIKNPDALVDIRPEDFDGIDICLRDTTGSVNYCSRKFGVIRETDGEPERICQINNRAFEGLKKARAELKKINPNYEMMIISTYRPPGYQQCLWVKETPDGYRCNGAVCGPRDRKTRARLPCKEYDLEDPQNKGIFNNCPHVNKQTMDLCAYDRTKVKLNERNQIDMTILQYCRKSTKRNYTLPDDMYYHPCTCRFTSWNSDMTTGSARTKIFTNGGVEETRAMTEALRKTGWVNNVPNEWWHFRYKGK